MSVGRYYYPRRQNLLLPHVSPSWKAVDLHWSSWWTDVLTNMFFISFISLVSPPQPIRRRNVQKFPCRLILNTPSMLVSMLSQGSLL